MYHKCKLVHADFSEYNILYYKGHLWIIDVSQSVEHDHPNALLFLRKDCENVGDFFKKNGVSVMTTRELFDFITDPTLKDEDVDQYLEKMQDIIANRKEITNEEEVDDAVFKKVHIPRTLNEMAHYERDHSKVQKGVEMYYTNITGMNEDATGPRDRPKILQDENVCGENDFNKDGDENAVEEEEQVDDSKRSKKWKGKGGKKGKPENKEDDDGDVNDEEAVEGESEGEEGAEEDGEGEEYDDDEDDDDDDDDGVSKKERKKMVKEAQREKRKQKIPKSVKKRKKKLAKKK